MEICRGYLQFKSGQHYHELETTQNREIRIIFKKYRKHTLAISLSSIIVFLSFFFVLHLSFCCFSRSFSVKLTKRANESAKLLSSLHSSFSSARLPIRIEYYKSLPSQIPVKHHWQTFGVQSPLEPPGVNCNTFNNK